MKRLDRTDRASLLGVFAVMAVLGTMGLSGPAAADQCINDDLVVDGSACVGFDCVCNESFGFDTIRLKENNLRIAFIDTSVAASFPRGDWQIRANESTNGGANEFAIDWLGTGATSGSSIVSTPFAVEGNAPNNALYVSDNGNVGFGTSIPSVNLHTVDGDTPTLRLEQNGSSGFAPQTWDVAGNETNFFIRDVTNGSQLPFRIRPDAPTNSIFVDTDGDVGLGTSSPAGGLHIVDNGTVPTTVTVQSDGNQIWDVNDSGSGESFLLNWAQSLDDFNLAYSVGANSFRFSFNDGNLTMQGDVITNNCPAGCGPADFVFEPGYELMELSDLESYVQDNRHLPNIPSADEMSEDGVSLTWMQMRLLEKIEELALYTIDQQKTIDVQQRSLDSLTARLEALEAPGSE